MIISRKRFQEEIFNRLETERMEMNRHIAMDDIYRELNDFRNMHDRDIRNLVERICKLEENKPNVLDHGTMNMRMLRAEGAIHELQKEVKKNDH